MVTIGDYNTLTMVKAVDFGVYLDGGNGVEILLPLRYVPDGLKPGDEIKVFVYNDSEDRLIATTEHPYITVNTFAFLQVAEVNNVGAFMNWGLPKDLLCPYREQRNEMKRGGRYLVYAYMDHTTKRIVASAKIEKFLGNTIPEYERGAKVSALVYQRSDIGYKVIVDNRFSGMIYLNETLNHPALGETVEAYVKNVRPDGKLDLTLKGDAADRIHHIGGKILAHIKACNGLSRITDDSTPEEIREVFGCSKKDFKKAVGHLLKARAVTISPEGLEYPSHKYK